MKVKSGMIDYNIVSTDDGSYYFVERRTNTLGQPNSDGESLSYINISKSDNSYNEKWSKEYFLALAKYDVFAVKPFKNEVLLFLSEYNERTKSYTIDMTRLNENGGIPKEKMFVRLADFPRGERKENYFRVKLAESKHGPILISDLSGKKSISYAFTQLSPDFKTISSTIIKRNGLPSNFKVEDVKIHLNHLVVLGKEYEARLNVEGKKRNVFQRYVLSIYNIDGQYQGDVPLDKTGKITTAKLADIGDKILFAGLYNNYTMREVPDGITTAVVDVLAKQFVTADDKKIESGIFANAYLGEKDTSELFKKLPLLSLQNRRRFSNTESRIEIRTIDVNPKNNTFIIAAEVIQVDEYDEHVYGNSAFGLAGIAIKSGEILKVYEVKTKDLLLIHADSEAKINWIKVVPKNQQETFIYAIPEATSYSSFKASYRNNRYDLIYNDSKANLMFDLQKPVHVIWDFKKEAALFSLSIDPSTGEISKSLLTATSNEEAILMPLKAIAYGPSFIVPARAIKVIGKDIYKIAAVR